MSNFSIYIASKTKHADKWRALRESGLPIISTWIDEADIGQTTNFTDLWTRCINEAKEASCLILYKEDGEILEGALLEAGAALSNNKPVHLVGNFKTFSFHPNVMVHFNLQSALIYVKHIEYAKFLDQQIKEGTLFGFPLNVENDNV